MLSSSNTFNLNTSDLEQSKKSNNIKIGDDIGGGKNKRNGDEDNEGTGVV